MKTGISKSLLFLFLVLCLFSCAVSPPPVTQGGAIQSIGSEETTAPEQAVEPPEQIQSDYLTIIAVGDNLVHDPILAASYKNGKYSFDSIYDNIRGYVLSADIAFVNQETVLGNEALRFTGYPEFCSPPELGDAIAAAGFNVINHANNHAMDRREAGVLSSISFWESQTDKHYLGIHRSENERAQRQIIINKNNFKIGFLSYTYGVNGIALPFNKPYLVSISEMEKMAAEIDALRPLCDYLVVSMHWGEEYYIGITNEQQRLTSFLAEHKVDLVIGHHPHVLGPFACVKRPDGGFMNVYYSLGNFLSCHAQAAKEALLGGMMYVRLKKTGNEISLEETGLIPIITHYNALRQDFSIYPLSEYTEELASKHWKRSGDREMTIDYFTNKVHDIFGSTLQIK